MSRATTLEAILRAVEFTGTYENELNEVVTRALSGAGVEFCKEVRIGPGSRIDFVCWETIGVELKVGASSPASVRKQLERYANSGRLTRLILLADRVVQIPGKWNDVSIVTIGLHRGKIAI